MTSARHLAWLGALPWLAFELLRWTGVASSMAVLAGVRVPNVGPLLLAVITEACWLLGRLWTPACLIAVGLLCAIHVFRRQLSP